MTIQDALERAKQLRRSREGSTAPRTEHSQAALDDGSAVAVMREPAHVEPVPEVHYPHLGHVAFDLSVCEHFNVLVTDQQLAREGSAAAAYRQLRSRILQKAKAGNWSCLGISSPGPGEGKTVTALNLAISIAREKLRKVYLLDLDMRNPSMLERVGADPPRVLSQFFTESAPPESVLFETDVENLVVAGNRAQVPAASELLASPRLDEFLQYIKRRSPGALIVIDLPPVLSTDEALVVAPRVDAMFLLVSEGLTRRDSLARAIKLLSDFEVAGIIMNRSSEDAGSDYYGY